MKKFLILLVILSIIPLIDLFHPGLPVTHDGQDHVARIANFYLNLTEGNVIPRWAPNLNWGYGHPILMFLYPLPSYIASLFHFLGFSLVDSVKIVFGFTFILSGIFMFLWLREFLDNHAAFIGGLLYMFAPYRFIDLYVRGALGEHVAFVFLPLSLYFFLRLSKEKDQHNFIFAASSLSIFGLLLSHNAISVMFLPLLILYCTFLVYFTKGRKELIKKYVLSIILGFGLSSFFLFPAFFEGKYTLRDIVTAKDYATRFTDFAKFVYSPWSYGISGQFSVQLGLIHWVLTVLAVPMTFILFRNKSKVWILGFASILLFIATLFLMLPDSKFIWDKITILQKFQFPWRLLSISVFITSMLGAIVISQIQYGLKNHRKLITLVFIVFVLLINKNYWHANGYLNKPESFFTGIYNGTTDTGESSPIWSVRFMEKKPTSNIQVLSGQTKVKEIYRSSTKHEYEINSLVKVRLRENTLYFPGWEVFVDGEKTKIEFQDPSNRGVITFFVPQGFHKINILFGETNFRLFSDIISALSVLFILMIVWKNKQFRLF